MKKIKVNESEYFNFLTITKDYIEENIKGEGEKQRILDYIEQQLHIRSLMLERDTYYDFYLRNKSVNKLEANIAYKQYLECKKELEATY